jgi:hypothetical protein
MNILFFTDSVLELYGQRLCYEPAVSLCQPQQLRQGMKTRSKLVMQRDPTERSSCFSVGFEVLSAVVIKSSVVWDRMPCSLLKACVMKEFVTSVFMLKE